MTTPEPNAPIPTAARPRSSIVLRLSFLYFGLMLVNMSIFWFASGSNQMRLIAEKATMSAQSISFEIFRRLQPLLDKAFVIKGDPTQAFLRNKETFLQSLRLGGSGDKLIIPTLRVFSTDLQVLLSYPAETSTTISPDELQHAFKAIQLKDLKNEIFYGVPDILNYRIDLYLPLTSTGVNDLVLTSRIPLEAIQRELASLVRLGVVMIGLLLLVQMAVGLIIYRTLIKPIQHVSNAAGELSRGEFTQISYKSKREDEIKSLVESFNHMSSELKVKDETIRQNLASIKKKNDIAQFELNIAQKIQASIMPSKKTVAQIAWSIEYQPLYTVSGDYYDILQLSDGSVAIFIGDASGHGVPAAFLTIMAKIYFSSLVEKVRDPAELLNQISVLMAAYLEMEGLYMTGFYLRIYPDNTAEYCNCIHPTPLILRKETGELEPLKSTGFYIGIINEDGKKNETKRVRFSPGDRLILYSDGITEAKNAKKKMFGLERLSQEVQKHRDASPAELKKALLESLNTYLEGVPLNDDLTILIAEIGEPVMSSGQPQPAILDESPTKVDGTKEEGQALLLVAESCFALKKYTEALLAYDKYRAQVAAPDLRVLFRMALCHAHLGRYDLAEQVAANAVSLWPEHPVALAQLALMQAKQGKNGEALAHITKALERKPDSERYQQILNLVKSPQTEN